MTDFAHRLRPGIVTGFATTVGLLCAATVGCGDDETSDSATTGVMTTGNSDSSTGGTGTSDSDSTSEPTTSVSTTASSTSSSTTASTTDPTESTGSTGDGSTGTTSGGIQPVACPAADLGSTIPYTIEGQTDFQDNELMGTCGGAGAPDIAYTFTAPSTGPFTFDTFGSAYDTVIYVLDGTCTGTELACDDDGLGGGDSVVSVDLTQGETYTIVVDGFGLFGDDFELHVGSGQLTCPRSDLGNTVPGQHLDSTVLATDEFDPSCASGTSGDFGYTFTAPSTGDFIFDTLGSDFNTVLFVLDGTCTGTEIACNDNAATGVTQSVVTVPMVQDQTYTIVVEGSFGAVGDVQLNVGELSGTCPDGDLGNTVPQTQTGATTGSGNTQLGACGGYTSEDETFTWTAPSAGTFIFDTEGSAYDTVLYVRTTACDDSTEVACNNDAGSNLTYSQVAVDLNASDTVAITVDGAGASGNYTLNITEHVCPGPDITAALPLTINGSTAGLINNLYGGCGANGAPEQTYLFTAPANGDYVFDTFGTGHDTVLYLLDGNTCDADVLICDDDTNGLQSEVQATLTMGQTVVVVVDGYSSNQGAFVLNIDQV